MAQQPPVDQCLLIFEASRSHSDTPYSVGLLWTSDRPFVEIYRVRIKSFPDYKHLLQENSVEYKHTLCCVASQVEYKHILCCVASQVEEFQPWIIFQQDGTPPHWGSHVRRFLDTTFPNRLIGRDGPTPWPPRSPDITPFDSFLWGMLRTNCFRHQFQILQI